MSRLAAVLRDLICEEEQKEQEEEDEERTSEKTRRKEDKGEEDGRHYHPDGLSINLLLQRREGERERMAMDWPTHPPPALVPAVVSAGAVLVSHYIFNAAAQVPDPAVRLFIHSSSSSMTETQLNCLDSCSGHKTHRRTARTGPDKDTMWYRCVGSAADKPDQRKTSEGKNTFRKVSLKNHFFCFLD